jgi:hypothetical protein
MIASNMPGFTADKSLYTTRNRHRQESTHLYVGREQGVIPQLPFLCEVCHWYCSFFADRLDCYVFCGRAGFCGPRLTGVGLR